MKIEPSQMHGLLYLHSLLNSGTDSWQDCGPRSGAARVEVEEIGIPAEALT